LVIVEPVKKYEMAYHLAQERYAIQGNATVNPLRRYITRSGYPELFKSISGAA